MSKTILLATRNRLNETPEGAALLSQIDRFHSPLQLADAMSIDPQWVRQWLYKGRMSRSGARLAEESIGVTKEAMRPDVDANGWDACPVEKVERPVVAKTEDARLLAGLAKKMGGVRAVCDAIGCTAGDFHTWKSRGRIPAIKLPTVLALKS